MLKVENDELRTKLNHMNEILLNMQRARFGQPSEKQKYVPPDQLSVFNEAEVEQDPKDPDPDEKTIIVPEHKRKPKGFLGEKIKDLPSKVFFLIYRKMKSSALLAESHWNGWVRNSCARNLRSFKSP